MLHANPSYTIVHFPSGKEDTVSIWDLAPCTHDAMNSVQDDTTDNIPNTHDAPDSMHNDTADCLSNTVSTLDSIHTSDNSESADANCGLFLKSTPVCCSQREKHQSERYRLS